MVIFFVSRWDEIFGRLKGLEIFGVIFYRFGSEIFGVILSIRIWEFIFSYVIFGYVTFSVILGGNIILGEGVLLCLCFVKVLISICIF